LFKKIGPLRKCGINWDQLGQSMGTAEVEYEKPEDAEKAIKEYNGILLINLSH
jgi:RNA recognition motif-containing protein